MTISQHHLLRGSFCRPYSPCKVLSFSLSLLEFFVLRSPRLKNLLFNFRLLQPLPSLLPSCPFVPKDLQDMHHFRTLRFVCPSHFMLNFQIFPQGCPLHKKYFQVVTNMEIVIWFPGCRQLFSDWKKYPTSRSGLGNIARGRGSLHITRWEEKRWRGCVYPQSQQPAGKQTDHFPSRYTYHEGRYLSVR